MNTLIIVGVLIFILVMGVNLIPAKDEEPVVAPPVVEKPKRKYKKRISKKNTITTAVAKKPVGRPKKTVE